MPRFFVEGKQISNNKIDIFGEDVKHIKNVLRKNIGDQLEICNLENGKSYNCRINQINNDNINTIILEELQSSNKEDNIKVDIYQGLPKSDKMELIIQKSVELGVNEIIPVSMKRCVVKIEPKDESKKIQRWQKIAESASKQSGRNVIPQIKKIETIKEIIKNKYDIIIVCYENEKENTIKRELLKLKNRKQLNIAIVIGPEGGLEENEVEFLKQNGAKIVTLGNRILRTETVALNVLSIIMYEFKD